MRLEGKVAIVMGAGQTPGSTVGNGRACALLFAREGARVLATRILAPESTARVAGWMLWNWTSCRKCLP